MIPVGRKKISIPCENCATFISNDLKPVAGQFQIAHDFRAEQAADIRAIGIEYAGSQFPAHGGAADPVVLFDHQHIESGALQIAGVDQSIMAGADDYGIVELLSRSCHAHFSYFAKDY